MEEIRKTCDILVVATRSSLHKHYPDELWFVTYLSSESPGVLIPRETHRLDLPLIRLDLPSSTARTELIHPLYASLAEDSLVSCIQRA
jgi:hypothetical protein